MLALDDVEAADTGRNVHADFVQIRLLAFPIGHLDREIRAGQSNLDEPAHFLEFFFFNPAKGIEVFDFAGDAAIEAGGIKAGDCSDTAYAGEKILPTLLRADAQRADQSNTRDDNSASQRFQLPSEVVRPSGVTSLWRVC